MDEPLSNLDAALRVATRAEILKLHQRVGTTTIYVTHDQVEAMTMGDRIAVMSKGVLEQAGTPQELYTQPDNLFVAGFIGSPAMNLVPVEPASADDGTAVLRHNGFVVRVPDRVGSAASGPAANSSSASGPSISRSRTAAGRAVTAPRSRRSSTSSSTSATSSSCTSTRAT